MTLQEKMAKLSSAEEFFNFFQVPFDPSVLNVARLHILKRMSEYSRDVPEDMSEEYVFELYRNSLLRAYLDFVHSSPMEQRVFKVHQQAVKESSGPLVSIALGGAER